MHDIEKLLREVADRSVERFTAEKSLLSFGEYAALLSRRPYSLTRAAPQYVSDMMMYFGTSTVPTYGGTIRRFKVFDDPSGNGSQKVVGQEEAQNEIYRSLREFVQRRQVDRVVLLHGPNGSSKSTMIGALMRGLEEYSRTEEGMLLRFNWVFSEGADRGGRMGFDPVRPEEKMDTFAFLPAERVSAKIPSELRDNPVFLIPPEDRRALLKRFVAEASAHEQTAYTDMRWLVDGDLSPKSKLIYNALMNAYGGDWKKVMRHVQVERWYISRRFRSGAVVIEPQGNIDAHARQLGHATMTGLPPVLVNEPLVEASGDLIDANGGVVEYSDFFKRPMEANKYLLTTAENGFINLQSFTAQLNLVLLATGNEIYLSAFRKDPMFSSFKARLALVRVPYLLQYSKEEEIYRRHLTTLPLDMHRPERAARIAAMWAVLTRLLPPIGEGGAERLRRVADRMTPLEKAKLYDHGAVPGGLSDEEKNLLKGAVGDLRREHDAVEQEFDGMWDAAYEGRRGISPREMLGIISEMALKAPGNCFSPFLVLRRLPELVQDPTLYEFLRLKPTKHGYHDVEHFTEELRAEIFAAIHDDIRRASEIIDEVEYGRIFRRYFQHLKAHETREKILVEKTGKYVDPDVDFMSKVERSMGVSRDDEAFRSSLMARAAGFKLSNPTKAIEYEEIFSEFYAALRESIFREQMAKVRGLIEDALVALGFHPGKLDAERQTAAKRFSDRLLGDYGYCRHCLGESLEYFLEKTRP